MVVEPIQDPDPEGITIPDQLREAYVQAGWVIATGDLEEDIEPGDLAVFVGWKERNVEVMQYMHWRNDLYVLHEDDIECILEEW